MTPSRPSRAAAGAMVLLLALTLFRLVYAAKAGLAWDEAHYWQWSRHPDISYYDQGPWIAYSVKLGTLLLGNTTLGVRLATIFYAAGASWLVFCTAQRWFGDRIALWTLGLLALAPLYAIGGVLATYDGPQVFFWAAALHALTKTLLENRARLWYVVGVCVALGILSKLTMVFFAPGVLLFLVLSPSHRHWLRSPHPYLALGVALLGLVPIVWWNAHHGWMGFLHTQALSSRSRGAAPGRWIGDFLGGQLLVVGPLVWLMELIALVRLRALAAANRDGAFFLWAFTLPVFVACIATALKSKLEVNWPAPMHLAGLMAVALLCDALWQRRSFGGRLWLVCAGALSALAGLLGFFPQLPGALGLKLSAGVGQKLNEPYGWDELAAATQSARKTLEAEGKPVFLAGTNYRVSSILAFYLPDQPEVLSFYFNARRDQYLVWSEPNAHLGQNCLLAEDRGEHDDNITLARRYFGSVEALPTVFVYRAGYKGPVKEWHLYLCRDFKGYDQNAHLDGY